MTTRKKIDASTDDIEKKAAPPATHYPSIKDLVERLKTMSPSYASLLAGNPMNRLILSTFNSTDEKHYVTLLFRMVPEASILLINLYYTMGPTDFDITVTAAISQSVANFIKDMDPKILTT